MSFNPFTGGQFAPFTSTTSSQNTTVPAGDGALVVYNGAANPVLISWSASVSFPSGGTWTPNITLIPPGMAISTDIPIGGGTLSYIAQTAGGSLLMNTGNGI